MKIDGKIEVSDPNAEVTFIAGHSIEEAPTAKISPKVTLKIGSQYCWGTTHPLESYKMSDFFKQSICESETYKSLAGLSKNGNIEYQIGTEQNSDDLNYKIHPNPDTNDIVNLVLELPEAKVLQFEVYDLYGKKLKTLFSGEKSAGYSSESYDLSDLSAGVYLYKIIGDNIMEPGKLMKVR